MIPPNLVGKTTLACWSAVSSRAEGNPAPTLAALELSPANTSAAYLQVVDALNNMWHKAGVVHAELNESNILYVP